VRTTCTGINQRTAVGLLERRIPRTALLIKALSGGWEASQLPRLETRARTREPAPSTAQSSQPRSHARSESNRAR